MARSEKHEEAANDPDPREESRDIRNPSEGSLNGININQAYSCENNTCDGWNDQTENQGHGGSKVEFSKRVLKLP